MSRKIYVIGNSTNYANWMEGTLTPNIEEADLVVLTGGADINPKLYGDVSHPQTYFSEERDRREIIEVEYAIKLGKPIFGTCRGLQLLTVMAGGKLIQHMHHNTVYGAGGSFHPIKFYDGSEVLTNSLHHQMAYPFNLKPEQYLIVAYAKGLSPFHLDGNGDEMPLPLVHGNIIEPESVFYPEINAFGQQSHLEMLSQTSPVVTKTRALLNLQISGQLFDFVLNSKSINTLLAENVTAK